MSTMADLMAMPGPGQTCLGVAVEIPPPYAGPLTAAREEFGDPMAHAIPPHVTLLPPTVVDDAVLPAVTEQLDRVAAAQEPFVMRLAGTSTFRPVTQVVFVSVADGAPECRELQEAVRTGPLEQELRFDYHPHVTVAHDLPAGVLDRAETELADFSATFGVGEFALFELCADGVWRVLQAFALRSHQAIA
ncbi:Phosphoesterase HXTX [Beutenbergia cavernae DSM 12333]|uniref:Phosphoesterase HXTX n=1 Tax=Beutenbergia cavernae (strain ATCC BAA-8 / DSM 12333 / CCUG 43141 / JCM 11478 / NBRC 16432 / NCIMB 13614 / HKI 0122) TaxID=471853 RepID=C5BZ86_BEUC1|nr:2'-5' RNA ligase family protein [Beutenbergia cavernae]ACQ81201.1 Phosphoesterase HXTX [Beutenbergia cavernae DSM 12333]